MRVRLLADGGAAAADPRSFFRSPEFLAAEGVSHTLTIESGAKAIVAIPLIVRDVPGSELPDATSPYGYPGGTLHGAAPDPADVDFSDAGLLSAFIRERIGPDPCLTGGTSRSQVQICDPAEPPGVRKRLREQIRRNERGGWSVDAIPGPEASSAQREAFRHAYTATMNRTEAGERYFFGGDYFAATFAAPTSWLLLASCSGRRPAAGAIAVLSDGLLHYYLGGTADEALADSPMKNLFAAMVSLSEQLAVPLSLGGGVVPGDSLEAFKQGFANRVADFVTHDLICDPVEYGRLSEGRPAGTFFPAYRAP